MEKWLNNYADGLLFLIAAIKMLAGLPSWSIELTCIQLKDISCQIQDLYNIGCYMAIIIQYSKTSTRNSHDILIPHILDAFCQDIIKMVIFVTHSFAEQIF